VRSAQRRSCYGYSAEAADCVLRSLFYCARTSDPIIKITTDFTAWMMSAHPTGLGGARWTLNFVVNRIGALVIAGAYLRHFGGETDGEEGSLDSSTVWAVTMAFFGGICVSAAVLIGTMNSTHFGIFYSLRTSADSREALFHEHDTHELKMAAVFSIDAGDLRVFSTGFLDEVKEVSCERSPFSLPPLILRHLPSPLVRAEQRQRLGGRNAAVVGLRYDHQGA
jgi:hypothetical protein